MIHKLLRSFTTGSAIGLMICNLLTPGLVSSAGACPPHVLPVEQVVCVQVAVPMVPNDRYLQVLNQNIYSALFDVPGTDAEMVKLSDEPVECGLYTADAGSGRSLTLELRTPITLDTDPANVTMSPAEAAFVTGVNFVARAACGVVESSSAAFWVSVLILSMDTLSGRQHVVIFGSFAEYVDGTVRLPGNHEACQPTPVNPNDPPPPPGDGPNPTLCAAMKQACADQYTNALDTCNAIGILCLAAFVLCVIAIGQAIAWCMTTGLACAALPWLISTCAKTMGVCLGNYALCHIVAGLAYFLCMTRARNHPACQGIYEQ